jgi:hypothetical protein
VWRRGSSRRPDLPPPPPPRLTSSSRPTLDTATRQHSTIKNRQHLQHCSAPESRGSAFGTSTGCGRHDRETRRTLERSLHHVVPPAHPASYPVGNLGGGGGRGLIQGVKRPGCKAKNSPPVSAEVKKMWVYIYVYIHSPHTSSWRSP